MFLLAIAPIVLILILMLGFRWGAARAGGAGYLCALVIAVLFFGAGPQLLAYAHVRALILTVDVLLIIWMAFLFYRVTDEAGVISTIGQALPHLTGDRGMQALIIGWVFASFLQGVGGFGVPVAVVSPILAGLGFTPMQAVVLPSLGHGWAVTFGSLGSSFQALMAATGQPDWLLSPPAALALGLSAVAIGAMVAHASCGWNGLRRLLVPLLALGLVMGTVQYLVVTAGFWQFGSFSGGLAGLVVALPAARRLQNQEGNHTVNGRLDLPALGLALSGYIILISITLAVQLLPGLKDWLGQVNLQVQFPQVSTALGYVTAAGASRKIAIFKHAGASLFYASALAYVLFWRAKRYQPGALRRILGGTIGRVMSSSISIASMVAMSVIMENSGMTSALAQGLAQGLGFIFPVVAPWIGAVGAFMTGSNTNSNVVFGALQMQTATLLHYQPELILAAQTAGAALASVIAPAKVVVGTSTTGLTGREGDVIRVMIPYMLLLVLLISILTLVRVLLF